MNIGIDARPLIKQKSGIGQYLSTVLDGLLKIDNVNTYYLISDNEIFYDIKTFSNIIKIVYKPWGMLPNTFYYEFALGRFLRNKKVVLDVFWGTQQLIPFGLGDECRKIVTIHDLAYKLYPKTVNIKIRFMLHLFARKSLEIADYIITQSEHTKHELIRFYKFTKFKNLKTVYSSGNLSVENNDKKGEHINDLLKRNYLLFIGTIEPRKNLKTLLDAFNLIKKDFNLDVVICGKYGWNSHHVMQQILTTDRVHYLDYVSDYEKLLLIDNCFAYVMPSKNEGFGTPVVEAMQRGKIVIVADNSALKELVEYDELRFETDSCSSLADIILKLKREPLFYQKAEQYCRTRGSFFSWNLCVEEIKKILTDSV